MPTIANAQSLALKSKLFRGFSDSSRLSILEALRGGSRSVGEIVSTTGLSQSNVSNHLGCLLECGLVSREPRGRFAFYRLSDPRVEALLALADELLVDVASGVDECVRYEEDRTAPAKKNAPR